MKILKLSALAAVMAAASMALVASTAAATELTNLTGMVTTGSTIAAKAEGTTTLHPPIGDIECSSSEVEGTTSNTGGASETVQGNLSKLTFGGCNAEVTVIEKGSLEIHTRNTNADSNGTLTSSGAQVTVTFLGFHCIFSTSATDIGTLTGSTTTGGNATLDIEATIPRTGGRSGAFCGSTAKWTGSYEVTNPSTLNVDGPGEAIATGENGGALTYTVNTPAPIWWENKTDSNLKITKETVHNLAVIETNGSPCGTINSTTTCKTRSIRCLKAGQTEITMFSGAARLGVAVIKCD